MEAGKPPPTAWMRGAMRLGLAGMAWLVGYPYIATILAVLAVFSVLYAIEAQVAKVLLKVFQALRNFSVSK
jgi:hypothetical protein